MAGLSAPPEFRVTSFEARGPSRETAEAVTIARGRDSAEGGFIVKRRTTLTARCARAGLTVLCVLCLSGAALAAGEAAGEGAAAPPPRLAILPFAVSGALEYEHIGAFVPAMLASRLSELGRFRFIDTVALRKEAGKAPSGALAVEEAAKLAGRLDADYLIAGAIRRSGGVTVVSAQIYARDGSGVGDRIVIPVVTVEDLLPKMEPLAEALATRLRQTAAPGEGASS